MSARVSTGPVAAKRLSECFVGEMAESEMFTLRTIALDENHHGRGGHALAMDERVVNAV